MTSNVEYLAANGGLVPSLDGYGPIGALEVYFPLAIVFWAGL